MHRHHTCTHAQHLGTSVYTCYVCTQHIYNTCVHAHTWIHVHTPYTATTHTCVVHACACMGTCAHAVHTHACTTCTQHMHGHTPPMQAHVIHIYAHIYHMHVCTHTPAYLHTSHMHKHTQQQNNYLNSN